MPHELSGPGWTADARASAPEGVASLERAAGFDVPCRVHLGDGGARVEAWAWNERVVAEAPAPAEAFAEVAARLAAARGRVRSELDVVDVVVRERHPDAGPPVLRFAYRMELPEVFARLDLTGRDGLVFLDDESCEVTLAARWPALGDAVALLAEGALRLPEAGAETLSVVLRVVDREGGGERELALEVPFVVGDPADLRPEHPVTAGLDPGTGLPFLVQRLAGGECVVHDYLVHSSDVDPDRLDGFPPASLAPPPRDWRECLACPDCRRDLAWDDSELACACGARYPVEGGVPRFLAGGDAPTLGPGEEWAPNPVPKALLCFLAKYPGGLVLDCGSGNGVTTAPNLVNLEVFPFDSTTVVGDGQRLPFREGTFDAVLSAAVLEHVPDPPAYCAELRRVLRPGGELRIDSAFLQAYHPCPDHYYNTTRSALRLATRGFRPVGLGVGPHQAPFVALQVWLHQYAGLLASDEQRERFFAMTVGELLALPPGTGPAELRIPPRDWHVVASGVYLHGVKVDED